jgi:hypothetical protein
MPERDAAERQLPDDPTDASSWVYGHTPEPNLQTPAGHGEIAVFMPSGRQRNLSVTDLAALPFTSVPNCLIVSTGHGTSGPFTFGGARLVDLLEHLLSEDAAVNSPADAPVPPDRADDEGKSQASDKGETAVAGRGGYRGEYRDEYRNEVSDQEQQTGTWRYIDLVSDDGFGTRVTPADLSSKGSSADMADASTDIGETNTDDTFAGSSDPTGADVTPGNVAGSSKLGDVAHAGDRPILLAYMLDGAPLTREQGLVRLIVPSETDDALRQVKWLATIRIV